MCGTQWIEATYPFAGANTENFRPEPEPCDWWPELSLPLPLPEPQVTALRYIAGRMNKICSDAAPATIAVFTGCDAAGKLMAAEALAYELQRPLYRVDRSEIIGYWNVDTEKYFALTLNAARAEDSILMLDNADGLPAALFKTLESYPGLSILTMDSAREAATALRKPAYYVVDFPFPYDTE